MSFTNESWSERVFGRTRMNRFRNLRELATAMMFWSQSEPEALPGSRHNDVIKRDQESMTITTFFSSVRTFFVFAEKSIPDRFFRFNLPAGPVFRFRREIVSIGEIFGCHQFDLMAVVGTRVPPKDHPRPASPLKCPHINSEFKLFL